MPGEFRPSPRVHLTYNQAPRRSVAEIAEREGVGDRCVRRLTQLADVHDVAAQDLIFTGELLKCCLPMTALHR